MTDRCICGLAIEWGGRHLLGCPQGIPLLSEVASQRATVTAFLRDARKELALEVSKTSDHRERQHLLGYADGLDFAQRFAQRWPGTPRTK